MESMDFIFGNTAVPMWAIFIVVLLNIPSAMHRSLLTTIRSQYIRVQLGILDSSIHDLELYIFENRDHLPPFLRMRVVEPELEK
jgi:hypothetical protein